MLHLTIISVGKLKETYWREAEAEYLKRLSAWAKINIIELKEESFTDKDNPEIIKAKEMKKIKSALPKDNFLVILTPEGKQLDSVKFAKQFSARGGSVSGGDNITFIIGGPLGLDEVLKKTANLQSSLSPLTFTHQMSRIILLEQIYRAFTILNNKKYHY